MAAGLHHAAVRLRRRWRSAVPDAGRWNPKIPKYWPQVRAMLACVCADAGTQLRLLRALADGLIVSCGALKAAAAAAGVDDNGSDNCSVPHDRAVW